MAREELREEGGRREVEGCEGYGWEVVSDGVGWAVEGGVAGMGGLR